MHKKLSISLALGTILLTGLSPVVINPAWAQESLQEYCDRKARRRARERAGNVIGDAIAGSIKGRIIGGIFGGRRGARRGARDGAIIGVIGSGANQRKRGEEAYFREYDRCIERER